jgi:glutathione reductase (NADPH)
MAPFDHDLFVIGGGSGGVRAARIAAGHGARVAVAEQSRYGGTCVIRGCIPKKLLVYAAHFHEDFADAAGYGWTVGEARFSWPGLIAAKDKEIARLEGIYRKLLTDAGAKVLDGRATLADAHTVVLDGKRVTAETILVATGGRAVKPAIPGAELAITSDEAFHLADLPRRIAVLGGGYIACEFAGIFNGLGAEVTLAYRGEALLRGFDGDVRQHLGEEIQRKGIKLVLGAAPARIEKRGGELAVIFGDGREIAADAVMAATGRHPNTAGIGLEAAGVKLAKDGAVAVDEWSRSSVANIYAVGDVTNRVNLTPVAIKEAHAFADTLYGRRPAKADHRNVAHAVFSQPSVSCVGLSEEDARREGFEVKIFRTRFRALKHTLSGRQEFTLMKLVVDAASDRVLGAHMVGAEAAEIIQGLAIAIRCGARKADFDATVGIHPTAAEEFVTMRTAVAPAPAH